MNSVKVSDKFFTKSVYFRHQMNTFSLQKCVFSSPDEHIFTLVMQRLTEFTQR